MESLRNNAWILMVLVGLVFLFYAFYNLIVIPGLDPADPERGWAWLTTNPKAIEQIKFYFRILGILVLTVAVYTLVIAATGYRNGEKWAWFSLLYLPVHIILNGVLFPWIAPILAGLLLVAIIGLLLPFRIFFPKEVAR